MIPPAIEVPGLVLFELEPVQYDRSWRCLEGGIGAGRGGVGIRIADDESQAFAVRRPGILRDSARQVGDPFGLTSRAIQQPELIHLTNVIPIREEGQVASIGAPARRGLARLGGREPHAPGSVPACHPDIAIGLVLGRVRPGDGVGHPGAVGRELRIADLPKAVQVIQRHLSLGWRLPHGSLSNDNAQEHNSIKCSQDHVEAPCRMQHSPPIRLGSSYYVDSLTTRP